MLRSRGGRRTRWEGSGHASRCGGEVLVRAGRGRWLDHPSSIASDHGEHAVVSSTCTAGSSVDGVVVGAVCSSVQSKVVSVQGVASVSVPREVRMGGIVDLNAADTKRGLAESTPSAVLEIRLSSIDRGGSEGGIGTKIVACISDGHVGDTARVRFVVVDRDGAFVSEHVSVDDEVNSIGIEDGFNRLAHEFTLEHGGVTGGVHGDIEHDDHPRSLCAVKVAGEVRFQPVLLERAGREAGVTRESNDESGANNLRVRK